MYKCFHVCSMYLFLPFSTSNQKPLPYAESALLRQADGDQERAPSVLVPRTHVPTVPSVPTTCSAAPVVPGPVPMTPDSASAMPSSALFTHCSLPVPVRFSSLSYPPLPATPVASTAQEPAVHPKPDANSDVLLPPSMFMAPHTQAMVTASSYVFRIRI